MYSSKKCFEKNEKNIEFSEISVQRACIFIINKFKKFASSKGGGLFNKLFFRKSMERVFYTIDSIINKCTL